MGWGIDREGNFCGVWKFVERCIEVGVKVLWRKELLVLRLYLAVQDGKCVHS